MWDVLGSWRARSGGDWDEWLPVSFALAVTATQGKPRRGEPLVLVSAATRMAPQPFTASEIARLVPNVSRARVFDILCELTFSRARRELVEVERRGAQRQFRRA